LATDFESAADGWAVGDYFDGVKDQALIEHWDGSAWSIVAAQSPSAGFNHLSGVAALSRSEDWPPTRSRRYKRQG